MTDGIIELVRELRPADAGKLDTMFPQAQRQALLDMILEAPRRPTIARRRRMRARSWKLAASVGGVAAAATVVAIMLFAGSAAVGPTRAIALGTTPNGDITVTVTDPFVAQKELDQEIAAAGLNVEITLVPVSPSLVGTVVEISDPDNGPQIEALGRGPCVTGGGGCSIGIEIPRNFKGSGDATLGRPARPGEDYESTTSAFAPGEALHCSPIFNEQVSQALPWLADQHVTVWWGNTFPASGDDTHTPPAGSDYIVDAQPVAQGQVWLQTSAQPLTAAQAQHQEALWDKGC